MPPELARKYQQQGMSPQAAQAKAYPGGNLSAGGPASAARPSPARPPGAMQGPGGAGGKGSAVQQVLAAGQRVIQMASQLGVLDQLKQMIAQADRGPGGPPGTGGPPGMGRPGMGGPGMGGPPVGGASPMGGAPQVGGGMRPPAMPQRRPPVI